MPPDIPFLRRLGVPLDEPSAPVRTLIIRAFDKLPHLHSNRFTLDLHADRVAEGIDLLRNAIGADRAVAVVRDGDHEARKFLVKLAGRFRFEVETCRAEYAAGLDLDLIRRVTGEIMPEQGSPSDIGCYVSDAHRVFAAAEAVLNETPLFVRPVTIAGAVRNPFVRMVAIGTPLEFCLEAAGGAEDGNFIVIENGPPSGRIIPLPTGGVAVDSEGFLVLPKSHPIAQRYLRGADEVKAVAAAACEQCNACTDLCPPHLLGHRIEPARIMRTSRARIPSPEDVLSAALCTECGLCSAWSCPVPLPVAEYIGQTRAALIKHKVKVPFRNPEPEPIAHAAARGVPLSSLAERLGLDRFLDPAGIREPLIPGRVVLRTTPDFSCLKKIGSPVRRGERILESKDGAPLSRYSPVDGRIRKFAAGHLEISA